MGVVSSVWRQPNPDVTNGLHSARYANQPGQQRRPPGGPQWSCGWSEHIILSPGRGSEGLGFAIPAKVVSFVYETCGSMDTCTRTELRSRTNSNAGLAPDSALRRHGESSFLTVFPGRHGRRRGLKVRDIVVAVDGHPILTFARPQAALL